MFMIDIIIDILLPLLVISLLLNSSFHQGVFFISCFYVIDKNLIFISIVNEHLLKLLNYLFFSNNIKGHGILTAWGNLQQGISTSQVDNLFK